MEMTIPGGAAIEECELYKEEKEDGVELEDNFGVIENINHRDSARSLSIDQSEVFSHVDIDEDIKFEIESDLSINIAEIIEHISPEISNEFDAPISPKGMYCDDMNQWSSMQDF